jgi:hypothetical protein
VQVRLADADVTGLFQAAYRLGRRGWNVLRKDRGAVRRPDAGSVEEVLDRESRPVRGRLDRRDEDAF